MILEANMLTYYSRQDAKMNSQFVNIVQQKFKGL